MRKNYLQPEMTIVNVALSSQLMDGSVLQMGTEGKSQGGARSPRRVYTNE